ncbi:putative ABC transporter permease [Lapidilactobacillus achengensis]|uniref:ABC transporter permease n=1 Tax=Lapidilactobacillus achengensis TaxID=2486000 RepID=A0ABW1UKQ3_9LACO|nr:putative ABC transporter permease [Lapidilactobacillus achengensis]
MSERVFTEIVLQFFIYALIGWLWETSLKAFKEHRFVDTGFLIGPITPIYGFGVVGVVYLLRPWQNQVVLLFVLATLLVTALEYLTGFLLEKMFHTKWWNYANVPLNIQGYVALPISLFWGICCVLIIKFVQPEVLLLVSHLQQRFGFILPVILIALGSFDFGFTLANLQSFRAKMQKLNQAIEERRAELSTGVAGLRQDVHESWDDFLEKYPQRRAHLTNLNFGQRHLLRSFPNMKVENASNHMDELKELVNALRKKHQK